ncbi:hypothetical protein HanIR_Chr07g0327061 [Helianthus annuus]|nr:hypothetical protein HanIR_Chr07g0327061 [Helianthus annuus]
MPPPPPPHTHTHPPHTSYSVTHNAPVDEEPQPTRRTSPSHTLYSQTNMYAQPEYRRSSSTSPESEGVIGGSRRNSRLIVSVYNLTATCPLYFRFIHFITVGFLGCSGWVKTW